MSYCCQKHVIKYCEKVYERSRKNLFWCVKNSGVVLEKLKASDFTTTNLSTMIFLLFTLLNLIIKLKIKLLILLKEPSKEKAFLTLHVMTETHFSLRKSLKNMHGLSKMYVIRWPFNGQRFIQMYDLAINCKDRLWGFQRELIVLPWLRIYFWCVMKGTLWCFFLIISNPISLNLLDSVSKS